MLMSLSGLAAIVFSRLGWPKVLGYILVGILMNEYTWGGSFLADVGTTRTIGQLGIVFLMFGMGISFSAKDMRQLRSVALPAAIFDTLVMIWLGYTVGVKVFGWSPVQSVFFGVAICDSATTLLAKVIDEMQWGRRPFAKYVLGTSVVEDIICVGAIAVATGFASGKGMSALALAKSLGGLTVFFLAVLVLGMVLVPRLIRSVAKRDNGETLLLAILGTCFFISYFAYRFDFSLALGAFLVGLVAACSDCRERIEQLMNPLKSMFSAMFFVSIGLLVDPTALAAQWPAILLVSAVVMVGKTLNITFASLATGLELKTAVQNGLSLAQIGEFAFMVALLYAGIVQDAHTSFFQIAVGVSLLTTLLNPTMVRLSDRVGDAVERRVPDRVRTALESYRAWLDKLRAAGDSPARRTIRSAAIRLGVYAVLMFFVQGMSMQLHRFDYSRFSLVFERYDRLFFFALASLLVLVLLPLVQSSLRTLADQVALLLTGDGEARWQASFRAAVRSVLVAAGLLLFFAEWTMLSFSLSPLNGHWQWVAVAVLLLVGTIGWKFFLRAGLRANQRFMESLTADERREGLARTMTITVPDGAFQRLRLNANSPAIGGTVVTLNIRAKTGASIVSVQRDGVMVRNIGPEWEFRCGDELIAMGDARQIAALKDLLGVMA